MRHGCFVPVHILAIRRATYLRNAVCSLLSYSGLQFPSARTPCLRFKHYTTHTLTILLVIGFLVRVHFILVFIIASLNKDQPRAIISNLPDLFILISTPTLTIKVKPTLTSSREYSSIALVI